MANSKKNNRYETPNIWHDLPLRNEEDAQFHFDDYAATLARLIASKNTVTPLTIGVSGAWGSGKTTLLRRVEKMLQQTDSLRDPKTPDEWDFLNESDEPEKDFRPCRTVWFNAWKYADEEQLLVALVRVIVQAMADDGVVSKVWGKLLDPSYPRRDVVNTVLSWFSVQVGDTGIKLNTGTPTPTSFAEKTALLDLFDDAFDKLLAAWVHRKADVAKINPAEGILAIFIDDLDRCLPEKTVQVLEAVKLFLDKKGCVFVLGADTRIVQQAVTKHYQETNILADDPADYLEKIIQLRFDLPPVQDKEMGEFVRQQVADNGGMQAHSRLIALGAAANPRKVKTFLNDLNLRWAMWRNMSESEKVIDFDDFVRWEVWMRAAPKFRKRAYSLYTPATRAKLVQDAFDWAAGNAEAAASFQGDLNREMRRVLEEIAPHKEHFTADVIDSLVHMALPPVDEEVATAKEAATQPETETAKARIDERDLHWVGTKDGMRDSLVFAEMKFQRIPAGEFLMGEGEEQLTADIPYDYYMARFLVTNEDFARFYDLTNHLTEAEKDGAGGVWMSSTWKLVRDANWKYPLGPDAESFEGRLLHPVVQVSWHDAQEYIAWLNKEYSNELPQGYRFSLPLEVEWEKAARGEYANVYPWGNEFDKSKCNSIESGIGSTSPVGEFSPAGDSPYGCADMSGNVWEWMRSVPKNYPYRASDDKEEETKGDLRALRGGAFGNNHLSVRCSYRYSYDPSYWFNFFGFRVAVAPISQK